MSDKIEANHFQQRILNASKSVVIIPAGRAAGTTFGLCLKAIREATQGKDTLFVVPHIEDWEYTKSMIESILKTVPFLYQRLKYSQKCIDVEGGRVCFKEFSEYGLIDTRGCRFDNIYFEQNTAPNDIYLAEQFRLSLALNAQTMFVKDPYDTPYRNPVYNDGVFVGHDRYSWDAGLVNWKEGQTTATNDDYKKYVEVIDAQDASKVFWPTWLRV